MIVYSNAYLALGGCGLAYAACSIIGIDFDLPLFIIIFSLIFIIYNIDRLKDDPGDFTNIPERTKFVYKHRQGLIIATVINAILLAVCIHLTSYKILIIILFIVLTGFAYSLPILPFFFTKKCNYKRIKDVPFLKGFVVVAIWTITIIILPIFLHSHDVNYSVIFMNLYVFIFCLSNVTMFDMRDVKGDKETGVMTIPLYFGIKKTKNIIYLLNFILFMILFLSMKLNYLNNDADILYFPIIYTFLYVKFFSLNSHKEYCSIIVDGNPLLTGIVALIYNNF